MGKPWIYTSAQPGHLFGFAFIFFLAALNIWFGFFSCCQALSWRFHKTTRPHCDSSLLFSLPWGALNLPGNFTCLLTSGFPGHLWMSGRAQVTVRGWSLQELAIIPVLLLPFYEISIFFKTVPVVPWLLRGLRWRELSEAVRNPSRWLKDPYANVCLSLQRPVRGFSLQKSC